MKLQTIFAIAFLSPILTTSYSQNIIPFSDKRWKINAQGQMVEFYKGYECLYLKAGRATLPDVQFLNGVIEFDICLTEQVSFSGFFFRQTSVGNYEEIYFRAQQSGNPDAYQYTPVFNGDPAWQLYHDQFDGVTDGYIHWKPMGLLNGYNSVIDFPFERWAHVKLLVKNDKAELYFDNKFIGTINKLLQEQKAGAIGVSSSIAAMRFANFSYTSTDNIALKTNESPVTNIPANSVMQWQVSNPFKEDALKEYDIGKVRSGTQGSVTRTRSDSKRLLRAAGLFALVAYTPKTGGELGSEQKDLRGVVQPQQQGGERRGRPVSGGLCGVGQIEADDPSPGIEQQRREQSAGDHDPPGKPARGHITIDQREETSDCRQ